jgi:hypothetical protein
VTAWTPTERRWRDELLAALVPASPPLPGLGAVALDDFWPAFDAAAAPLLLLGLRAAVFVLAVLAPLILLGRWRLFSSLAPEERDRLLVRAVESRSYLLRQMVTTLKAVACFAYLRDPRVRAAIDGREAAP